MNAHSIARRIGPYAARIDGTLSSTTDATLATIAHNSTTSKARAALVSVSKITCPMRSRSVMAAS